MTEAINLLNDNFEQKIKTGYLEESLLINLENDKIKIFTILNSGQYNKFIKGYVSKVWNLCKMLNYARSIKDTDNNNFILRVKDFLCDLIFLIFSKLSEVSLQDVFNLLQIVTEVGSQWIQIDLRISAEGWIRKIDNLMKYLITKISDIENLIHLEKKFYINFMEYLTFYINNFISLKNVNNNIEMITFRNEELLKIINLLKNLKFLENENSTKIFFTHLITLIKTYYNDNNNEIENVFLLYEAFDEIKNKNSINNNLIINFYKFYIQLLIDNSLHNLAENVLKNLFEFIPNDSIEEVECYLSNFDILSNYTNPENLNKIKNILEILFEHKDFNFDHLEIIFIISNNSKIYDLVFEIFINKLKFVKLLRLSNSNSIIFNFENLKNLKTLSFVFIYSFFKSNLFHLIQQGNYLNNNLVNNSNPNLIVNLLEIIKILSEVLLENYSLNYYNEEHSKIIPILFKNIIILFLKLEKPNENFSSYYLIEIIKKLENSENEKEFIELSLQIYIEKKDFMKLNNMIKELENKNLNTSLYFYSNLIIIIKEGKAWNSLSQINLLCMKLNSSENFHILYYLKLFNFVLENSFNDFNLISTILQNFSLKFFEILNNQNEINKIKLEDKNNNLSYIDVILEVLGFYSKLNNFPQNVIHFTEFLNILANNLENEILNENSHVLTNNITKVLEILNLLLNYKNGSTNNNINSNLKNCHDYPEFILLAICKLLNFIFTNFFIFLFEFFNIEEDLVQSQIKSILEIFEIYKNLSIFYFSFEFTNLKESNVEENQDLNENNVTSENSNLKFENLRKKYNLYQNNFNNAISILKNKFAQNLEYLSLIDDKITKIINSTKFIDNIIFTQIMSKTENEANFEEYVIDLANNNLENKKFIFMINSILYQNGFKLISSKFVKNLLDSIMNRFENFVPEFYTIEEVFNLFKDYINLEENIIIKVALMQNFSNIVIQLKRQDSLLCENVEWILYKIFTILEGKNEENKINKTDKEFQNLRQIYDQLNLDYIRSLSFILNNLFDIVFKKLII